MGKYSLDAYEQYPLVKLRPGMRMPEPQCIRLLELEAGCPVPADAGADTVLRLRPDPAKDIPEICAAIRRTGESRTGDLAGVLMVPGTCTEEALAQLLRAYRESFGDTVLLAEPELVPFCRREGVPAGLWLSLSEGILPLRRRIAEGKLSRNWEHAPVYLDAGGALTPEELDAARRWHASGANCMAPLGPQMTLRRMMFPRDLTAGGWMPLRMWWQNIGTAPLYRKAWVRLELRAAGDVFPISIAGAMEPPGLGDSTFNTTARLPEVPKGNYSLWCGLESGGSRLPLAMAAEEREGMYCIGTLTLDQVPRPYLRTLWEIQYADGYYPLEDPEQPE